MKISIEQLQAEPGIGLLVIHSMQNSLYQASAVIGDQTYRVIAANGRPLTSRNKTVLQQHFKDCRVAKYPLATEQRL